MGLAKKLIDKSVVILNARIKKESAFFGVPPTLKAIRAAAASAIQKILNQLKSQISSLLSSIDPLTIAEFGLGVLLTELSDDNIRSVVKSNKDLRAINNHISRTSDNSIASEISLACSTNQNLESALSTSIDGASYLQIALSESDFDQNTSGDSPYDGIESLYQKFGTILPILLVIYSLFLNVKDYILNNRYPSQFRAKYLQDQVRQLGLLLKKSAKNIGDKSKDDLNALIIPFKAVDALIIGLAGAGALYLSNRSLGQKKSKEGLEEISSESTCQSMEVPIIPPINPSPLDLSLDSFSCPLPDNLIVPHQPLEEKISSLSCEVETEESTEVKSSLASSIASKAILQNLDPSLAFTIYLRKDQELEMDTVVGKIGDTLIYSPVKGYVSDIQKNSVWIRDISDIGNNLFEETAQELNGLYEEMGSIKRFVKDFYIDSWMPAMIASTPYVDPSSQISPTISKIGIGTQWRDLKKSADKSIKSFNKEIEKVSGPKNIKTKAENGNLISIKNEFDKEEDLLFKRLNKYADAGIGKAKLTRIQKSDLSYIEYYFDLLYQLNLYDDNDKIVSSFKIKINQFLIDRFFIEGYNLKNIEEKINQYCDKLSDGTFSFYTLNYFKELNSRYLSSKDPQSAIKDYVSSLGVNNKKDTTAEKDGMVSYVVSLFNFSRQIIDLQNLEQKYTPLGDISRISFEEGSFIKGYFANLNRRMGEIPLEILKVEKKLDDLSDSFVPPSIRVFNDEQYEWYGLKGQKRVCPPPVEEDEYLSPYTSYTQGDIQYWLRYCAFATLASVANPVRGWSTGIPPPIGPIPFPVVYIPFKSFMTKWGFIVVGLTITGIYPFPWILFGNLSSNYNTPFGDPTAIIKNEIKALKESLSGSLKSFKKNLLEDYLSRTAARVQLSTIDLESLIEEKKDHKEGKPLRDRSKKKPEEVASHLAAVAEWNKTQLILGERIAKAKSEKYLLEKKYKIVYDVYNDQGSSISDNIDPSLDQIELAQQALTKQLDKLDLLTDQAEKILIPLPISMKPDTANFGITAKNPKPIIQITNQASPETSLPAVDKILDKFALKTEDFMSNKFGDKLSSSIVGGYKKYKKGLSLAKFTMVPSDPFPKYENLTPANLAWTPFLLNSFTVSGAKTYGFPGQNPLPI